jgi:coatomer subunit beta'
VLHEVGEKVRTAQWLGDCFVYTNSQNRLNYCVGGEVSTIAHLDRKLYLLGYLPQENRLYLIDKSLAVVSYTLHLNVVNYQTLVLRGDTEAADRLLPSIPKDQYERLSLFLEAQNLREKALEVLPALKCPLIVVRSRSR